MTITQQQRIIRTWPWFMPAAGAALALGALWLRRIETRRDFRELGAEQLADVGRTEADRRRECSKWFWQQ